MSDLWGRLNFDGTNGATVAAADLGTGTVKDGSGTAIYKTPGLDGTGSCMFTTGQSRFKHALEVPPDEETGNPGGPLPAAADVWVWIRRASGQAGNNTNGTPTVSTNVASFLAASNVVQLAVAVTAAGKFSLVKADTGTGSNVQSIRSIYCDGNAYDAILEIHQATQSGKVKVHAGPDHPDYPQGYLLDTMEFTAGSAAIGTAQIIEGRIGSVASADTVHKQRLDYVLYSDTPLVITEPVGAIDLQEATTMPLENGFSVNVRVSEGDEYRLRVYDALGNEVDGSPTSPVTPYTSGARIRFAQLRYEAGEPWTQYEWQVETKVAGVWTDAGASHTLRSLPQKGGPIIGSVKLSLRACQQSNEDYYAHNDIEAWGPHYDMHGGDYDYANNKTATLAAQLGHLLDQNAAVPKQKQHKRDYPGWTFRSDHDGEGGNDAFASPTIPYTEDAFRTLFGYANSPITGSLAQDFWIGRFHFIVCDIRTLARTDPAAITTANGPDAGPSGMCVSAAEEAWIIEKIGDPDAAFTFFCTDAPWVGPDTTDGKGDTWRCYRAQRARIGAAMSELGDKGAILSWDLHGVGACSGGSLNPDGGWPVLHNAGIRSAKGEANRIHNGDPDNTLGLWDLGYWPPAGNPSGIAIATYGRLELTDDGINIGIVWVGRSMAPGVVDNSPASWTYGAVTAPAEFTDGWSVGLPDEPDTQLDLSTYAMNVQNRDAGFRMPPRRGKNLIIPTRDGRLWNSQKKFDENSLILHMYALGSNEDGTVSPYAMAQVLYNLRELNTYFTSAYLLEFWRKDGAIVKRCYGEVLDAFDLNSHNTGEVYGDFIVNVNRPMPFFEDLDEITQTVDFVPKGGDLHNDTLVFSSFAGGDAPNDDCVVTAHGKLPNPRFSDANSLGYVEYLDILDNGQDLEFDNANMEITRTDNDTDAIGKIKRAGSGSWLTLYPRHRDGAYQLRVAVDDDIGGAASVTVRGRRKYVRA